MNRLVIVIFESFETQSPRTNADLQYSLSTNMQLKNMSLFPTQPYNVV